MPDWLGIVIAVLGAAQMIYNIILGLYVRSSARREADWQKRETDREKDDAQREQDLSSIRQRCDLCRRELDDRCQERERVQAEHRAGIAVMIERLGGESAKAFATREDVRELGNRISSEMRRLFEGLDAVRQRVASIEGRMDQ